MVRGLLLNRVISGTDHPRKLRQPADGLLEVQKYASAAMCADFLASAALNARADPVWAPIIPVSAQNLTHMLDFHGSGSILCHRYGLTRLLLWGCEDSSP